MCLVVQINLLTKYVNIPYKYTEKACIWFTVHLLVSDDCMKEWYWRPRRDNHDICRRPMEEEEQEAGEVLVGGC